MKQCVSDLIEEDHKRKNRFEDRTIGVDTRDEVIEMQKWMTDQVKENRMGSGKGMQEELPEDL